MLFSMPRFEGARREMRQEIATRKNARKGRSSAGVKAEKRGVKKGGLKLKDLDAKDSKAIRGGAEMGWDLKKNVKA